MIRILRSSEKKESGEIESQVSVYLDTACLTSIEVIWVRTWLKKGGNSVYMYFVSVRMNSHDQDPP